MEMYQNDKKIDASLFYASIQKYIVINRRSCINIGPRSIFWTHFFIFLYVLIFFFLRGNITD